MITIYDIQSKANLVTSYSVAETSTLKLLKLSVNTSPMPIVISQATSQSNQTTFTYTGLTSSTQIRFEGNDRGWINTDVGIAVVVLFGVTSGSFVVGSVVYLLLRRPLCRKVSPAASVWYVSLFLPLKHQSQLQQTRNFDTSFPIFEKNKV